MGNTISISKSARGRFTCSGFRIAWSAPRPGSNLMGLPSPEKVWDGRANLEEFETDSAGGHIEGLTLRVYNPLTRQWSIYWANSKDPTLGQPLQPMIGEFKNGRGEFYDQELWKSRAVYVLFIWSDITPNSAHFEQAYSDDGGKTWEVNWITDQTRVPDTAAKSH